MQDYEKQQKEVIERILHCRDTMNKAIDRILEAWKEDAYKELRKQFTANKLVLELYYEDFSNRFRQWVTQNHQSLHSLSDLRQRFEESLKDYCVMRKAPKKGKAGLMHHFWRKRQGEKGELAKISESEFLAALLLSKRFKNVFLIVLFDILQLHTEEVSTLMQEVMEESETTGNGRPSLTKVLEVLKDKGHLPPREEQHRLFSAKSLDTQLSKAWGELFEEARQIRKLMNAKNPLSHG